jgi:hypothetical protein
MVESNLSKLDCIAWENKRAKIKLKSGEELICRPRYASDSEEDDEDGITIPAYMVRDDHGNHWNLMEKDIESVEEIE